MRRLVSVAFGLGLSMMVATTAIALTVDASPESQSHAHGIASNWTGTWHGSPPYSVTFFFGDGTSDARGRVSYTSSSFSHGYWPCTTTTFTAHLDVDDQQSGQVVRDYVTARELGGNPC
jgi:hypothetical protein